MERILLESVPDSVALRASIVIGARSRSFRFLVRLVERMPVLALPAWRRFRSKPIDERDIVEMLAACASVKAVGGRSLDAGGAEILTYREIVERIADLMMLARPSVGIGLTVTPIAARLAAVIADERPELVLPLMESLTGDLLPRGEDPADLLGVDLHSFDSAVNTLWVSGREARSSPHDEHSYRLDRDRASPQEIWDTVMNPARLGDWVTIHRKLRHSDEGTTRVGFRMDQQIHLRGVSVDVHWTLVECVPGEHAVWKGRGPARSRARTEYTLSPVSDDSTRFDYRNEFNAPLGPLGALASRALVGGMPEREATHTLERLRTLMEG